MGSQRVGHDLVTEQQQQRNSRSFGWISWPILHLKIHILSAIYSPDSSKKKKKSFVLFLNFPFKTTSILRDRKPNTNWYKLKEKWWWGVYLMGSNNWNSRSRTHYRRLTKIFKTWLFSLLCLSDIPLRLHLMGQEVQPLLHFISLSLSGRRTPPSSKAKAAIGFTQETAHLEQTTRLGNVRAITHYAWSQSGEGVSPQQKHRRSLLLLIQSKFFHWRSLPFPSPISYNLHPHYLLQKPNYVLKTFTLMFGTFSKLLIQMRFHFLFFIFETQSVTNSQRFHLLNIFLILFPPQLCLIPLGSAFSSLLLDYCDCIELASLHPVSYQSNPYSILSPMILLKFKSNLIFLSSYFLISPCFLQHKSHLNSDHLHHIITLLQFPKCSKLFFICPLFTLGFPGGSAGKESTCNAGDLGSIPGLGRSPGEGKGYPL